MIYFLYITFLDSLRIYNIKLLTIILLTFAIPFSGYGQVEDPLSSGCYPRPTLFFFGLSGGLNYSKINIDKVSTEYLPSGQIAIEFQSFLSSNIKSHVSMILYGLSYESKNYNFLNSNSQTIQLESSYLTIPIKYQYCFIDLQESIPFSVVLGCFYSLLLNEQSIDNIEYIPNSNYGIILGPKIEIILTNGFFLHLDYNLQYGFASKQNTVSNSGNVSHLINFGFKFPSTIF